MSRWKKPIKNVLKLSGKEAQQTDNWFKEGQKRIKEALKSSHELIKEIATLVDYSLGQIKWHTVEEFMASDDIDAFSRIKDPRQNKVCSIQYFYQKGDSLVEVVDEAIQVEQLLEKKAKDLGFDLEKHDLHLFAKDQRHIEHIAKSIKEHTNIFGKAVFYLQNVEMSSAKDKDIIRENFAMAISSLEVLSHDLHDIVKAFNHSVDRAIKISKDDVRLRKILEDHLILLEQGVYEQASSGESTNKEEETPQQILMKAMKNRDDEVFSGKKGAHGGYLSRALHEHNNQIYKDEENAEKNLKEFYEKKRKK